KLISKEEFALAPKKGLFGERTRVFPDPEKWFRFSYNKRRMCNAKLSLPPQRETPAPPVGEGIAICVRYENGSASRFCPEWSYDEPTNKWSVVYREQPFENNGSEFARYSDNSKALRESLLQMSDFANSLGREQDTGLLLCCIDELDGRQAKWEAHTAFAEEPKERIALMHTPKLPEKLAHIYCAASRAPRWSTSTGLLEAAENVGRAEEYRALMDKLCEQANLAIAYAVNEC
ncbi:MAG: hypothetical protein ACI4Q4_08510, partial [Oscillospiraceae bacterium]